jgi:hypothetical protein
VTAGLQRRQAGRSVRAIARARERITRAQPQAAPEKGFSGTHCSTRTLKQSWILLTRCARRGAGACGVQRGGGAWAGQRAAEEQDAVSAVHVVPDDAEEDVGVGLLARFAAVDGVVVEPLLRTRGCCRGVNVAPSAQPLDTIPPLAYVPS